MPEITRGGVTVTVTGDYGYSHIDEREIWETAVGYKDLHQSNLLHGAPTGYIGYVHNLAENSIYAVTALDVVAHTITITKSGIVKKGVHHFK